jgi:aryl-alcohol dehydrogenase-like predicted oxidoreductase
LKLFGDDKMKLALGSAQFGLQYGVANTAGRVLPEHVGRILRSAAAAGVDTIDTAYHYGDSESVLGSMSELTRHFQIVTKTRTFSTPFLEDDKKVLIAAFFESCRRLRSNKLYALLVHKVDNLLSAGGNLFYQTIKQFKTDDYVGKIGASLYSPDEGERLLDRFEIDIVQIPLNLMDQRMLNSGMLAKFKQQGIEVHVRSAFLQGLFFLKPSELSGNLQHAAPYVEKLQEAARQFAIPINELALRFLLNIPEVDKIVVGVDSLIQLEANLDIFHRPQELPVDYSQFACGDVNLINPTYWS